MLSAATVIAVSDSDRSAEDGAAARIEADWTGLYAVTSTVNIIISVSPYQQIVSTGAVINYSLFAASGSPLPLSQLNITWRLQDDLNATMFKYGANISCIWMVQANHSISVTYCDASNASNIGRKYITVDVRSDFDVDGLPDVWERQNFKNLISENATSDWDSDGWTNLEEYNMGTNPKVANMKPGFFEQYWWLFVVITLILMAVLLLWFVILPKKKAMRDEVEKKKIAAAVDVEKSLLGLDELEEKPKK
jgi:heme exporter protein D